MGATTLLSTGGGLAWAHPALLGGLALLPATWWLSRLTPPAPRKQVFPSVRLLHQLKRTNSTNAKTPWWLLALRCAALGCVVLGLAGPEWRPPSSAAMAAALAGGGRNMVMLIDNGWASLPNWAQRLDSATTLGQQWLAQRSEGANTTLAILTTAPQPDGRMKAPFMLGAPNQADADLRDALASALASLTPRPWPVDRQSTAKQLRDNEQLRQALAGADVWVLSDGINQGGEAALEAALKPARQRRDMRWDPCLPVWLDMRPPNARSQPSAQAGVAWQAKVLFAQNCATPAPLALSAYGLNTPTPSQRSDNFSMLASWKLPAGKAATAMTVPLDGALDGAVGAFALNPPTSARAGSAAALPGPAAWHLLATAVHGRSTAAVLMGPHDAQALTGAGWFLQQGSALHGQSLATLTLHQLESPNPSSPVPPALRAISLVYAPDGTLPALSSHPSEPDEQRAKAGLMAWVRQGGTLVRFAGPVAGRSSLDSRDDGTSSENPGIDNSPSLDETLSVPLLGGTRQLGGPLSLTKPPHLASFPAQGPFAGLAVPQDVTVERQILARPTATLNDHVWASLEDGTPLVTARREGKGEVVFFHTAPLANWTTLPLAGLWPAMLERLAQRADAHSPNHPAQNGLVTQPSTGGAGEGNQTGLPPWRVLTPQGSLTIAGPDVLPLPDDDHASPIPVSALHPAGLYGRPGGFMRALNLAPMLTPDRAALAVEKPLGILARPVGPITPHALGPILMTCGLGLLMLAQAILLAQSLKRAWWKRLTGKAGLSVLMLASGLGAASHAWAGPALGAGQKGAPTPAQSAESDWHNTLETRLAWLPTGDQETDDQIAAGMKSLTDYVNQRSNPHLGAPIKLDLNRDDLGFYPLIYWPILPNAHADGARAQKISLYMQRGGMVLVDRMGAGTLTNAATSATSAEHAQNRALEGVTLPTLLPLTDQATVAHTFYILHGYPGRAPAQPVLGVGAQATGHLGTPKGTENQPTLNQGTDGGDEDSEGEQVTPILIGNGDWARAWAMDKQGNPIMAVEPGGEDQRRQAQHFGLNLVIYALTGTYKDDQRRYPKLLQQLPGQGGAKDGSPGSTGQAPGLDNENDGESEDTP
ncbi:DUF4159 domain-containing protein [Formicincola oecophyllae]|uniref:DUF4159 domain-containing protein n=1 Tax=Formicincola oecophyllae TaxID=2558361 RepID=A0A4Y6U7I6_9PROT|nr:DUF4159 domain-containing protein [Formicincola oecophyllae]QDH13124.1 DUF4159 domain-containing protein [Formicincola oecophyllae]